MLFIIAVNVIFIVNEVCIDKCLYGDDLVLFYSTLSAAIIKHKFQRALNKIIENAENSVAKTNCVSFYSRRVRCSNPTLKINGVGIQYQREMSGCEYHN